MHSLGSDPVYEGVGAALSVYVYVLAKCDDPPLWIASHCSHCVVRSLDEAKEPCELYFLWLFILSVLFAA